MANYPRIYSLCTVGVRQHYNSEYLFHSVRTDFTGGNGLGKSIIGDLMQLIFIPKRDMWKPGTEGIGKDERRVEGIPLNKEYIQYAYAFLNIEKKQGQFITMGVYISKTPRIPVRPFIIQGGTDFEGGNFVPFSRPLHPEDFLSDSNAILDLREIVKHLKSTHNLHMKDFFQTEGIMQYYDILYKNSILPVNLSKPENLKTYAKVIQSFARAKSLDITNSKSLQNFLFDDSEEIKRTFEEQKEQLQSLLKQYKDNHYHTQELQAKQKKLLALLESNYKGVEAKEIFLKSSATYAHKQFEHAHTRFDNNKKHIENSTRNLLKQKNELEKVTEDIYRNYTNLQKICSLMRTRYESLLKEFSDDTILSRKQAADVLRDKINLLSTLYPIVLKYEKIENIENKFSEQIAYKTRKASLNRILSLYSLADFEKSVWAKEDFFAASRITTEKLSELPQQIEELETLVGLFEGTRDDSFFHWAIQNNQPLTKEQETILMYLKELSVSKPQEVQEGVRYIANPTAMLGSFEKEEGGIWISFGELREFVPLVKKQRFTNTKNLRTVLEKDTKAIKLELEEAHKELAALQRLSEELSAIGFNQELSDIYKKRIETENYVMDNSLNEEKIELIRINWIEILQLETMQAEFAALDKEAIELAKMQSDIRNKMNSAKQALSTCEYEFTKLKLESNVEILIEEIEYSNNSIDQLEEGKLTYEASNKTLNEQKTWAEKYSIAAEGELRGFRSGEPLLKQQMEEALAHFNERKQILETDTGIVFEPELVTAELNETIVERLERQSEALQEQYHEEFTRVMEAFEETKGNKCPELVVDKFNFKTLVNILCGKLGLDGLAPELERLNEELKKFGDLQLTIILDVFKKVEVQYNAFKKLVTELNFFFKENRISGVYNFQVDFNNRKDISVDWIRRMREMAKFHKLSAKLFITTDSSEAEASPEKLILNIAKQVSDVGDCEITDLLDPKFYFDLRVGLYDDQGNRYPGSGGEAYTALALLCIGRMSVIQRDKNRPGVRFILIEELSNIDDTNFGLFPEIAKMFGYQLMTMTPKPFGSYSETEWYLHMLIRGKDKNINYQPMSFFRTRKTKQRLEEYMKGGAIDVFKQPEIDKNHHVAASEPMTDISSEVNTNIAEVAIISEATAITEVQESEVKSEVLSLQEEELNTPTIEDDASLTIREVQEITSIEVTVVSDEELPSLPKASENLSQERKDEFMGMKDETPIEDSGLNENTDTADNRGEEIQ